MDPGAGKGKGTNRPGEGYKQANCRWLERARFSVQCCIFEVANDHLLLVSHYCFYHFGLSDGCEVIKSSLKALNVLYNSNAIIIFRGA